MDTLCKPTTTGLKEFEPNNLITRQLVIEMVDVTKNHLLKALDRNGCKFVNRDLVRQALEMLIKELKGELDGFKD